MIRSLDWGSLNGPRILAATAPSVAVPHAAVLAIPSRLYRPVRDRPVRGLPARGCPTRVRHVRVRPVRDRSVRGRPIRGHPGRHARGRPVLNIDTRVTTSLVAPVLSGHVSPMLNLGQLLGHVPGQSLGVLKMS